jgi:hypothetical protein
VSFQRSLLQRRVRAWRGSPRLQRMDRDRFGEKDSDFLRSLRQVQTTFAVMRLELSEFAEAVAEARGQSLVPVEVSRIAASAIANAARRR